MGDQDVLHDVCAILQEKSDAVGDGSPWRRLERENLWGEVGGGHSAAEDVVPLFLNRFTPGWKRCREHCLRYLRNEVAQRMSVVKRTVAMQER